MVTEQQIKLARDKFKEISGITIYTPDEGTLDDFEQSRYDGLVAALEAALSAAEPEPVAWYWEDKSGCYHITMDRPDVQEMAAEFFCDPKPLYDRPQQPAPSVALKAKCKNCGSDLNSWFTSNRVNSVAVDGRLKSNEISCDFVLGCDECSETLRVVPADEIASQMNAALSAQVQDVAGWQLVPKQPTEEMLDAYWGQTGESEAMRSRVQARAKMYYHVMLAAAPAKQEGGANE